MTRTGRHQTVEEPENFSWVDKGWIAGCASPTEPGEYTASTSVPILTNQIW